MNAQFRVGQAGAPVLLHVDPVWKPEIACAFPQMCRSSYVVALLKKPGHVIQWHAKAGLPGCLSIVVVQHVEVVPEPDEEDVMVRKILALVLKTYL